MKAAIISALRAKVQGLTDKNAGILADKLISKITEESQIETAIENFDNAFGINEFLSVLKSEGDRRANEAVFKVKQESNKPPKPENPKPTETDPKTETPTDPMLVLLDEIRAMRGEVTGLKTEKVQESLRATLHTRLTESKIPLALAKNVKIESADQLDSVFDEISQTNKELQSAYGTVIPTGRPTAANQGDTSKASALANIKNFVATNTSSGNSLPVAK